MKEMLLRLPTSQPMNADRLCFRLSGTSLHGTTISCGRSSVVDCRLVLFTSLNSLQHEYAPSYRSADNSRNWGQPLKLSSRSSGITRCSRSANFRSSFVSEKNPFKLRLCLRISVSYEFDLWQASSWWQTSSWRQASPSPCPILMLAVHNIYYNVKAGLPARTIDLRKSDKAALPTVLDAGWYAMISLAAVCFHVESI